jgi:hypothetical protein
MIAYILSAVLVGAAAARSFSTLTAQSADLAAQEAQVIYKTNQVRAQNGLAPLRANVQLTRATRWFAREDNSLNPSVVNCTAGTAHLDFAWPHARRPRGGFWLPRPGLRGECVVQPGCPVDAVQAGCKAPGTPAIFLTGTS